MSDRNGRLTRFGLSICLALALGLATAGTASAAATLGQLPAANPPPALCSQGGGFNNTEYIEPTVTSGASYVVPPGGVAITSWSTKAAAGTGQQLTFKVFRKVSDPGTYQVVGHDGPQTLNPGVLNTFSVSIPVQPGDVIGAYVPLNSADSACIFDSPGNSVLSPNFFGDHNDGETVTVDTTNPEPDASLNVSAVAGFKASNDIDFVKVKKNKANGTAVLTVDVPGPGTLSLKGAGVKPQRSSGATISKKVTEAGKVKLKIKAKGAKKAKLLDTGKVKVKVKVTYRPSASGGDVAGDPNTDPKKIKLIDK
jgi:hypothetical protein